MKKAWSSIVNKFFRASISSDSNNNYNKRTFTEKNVIAFKNAVID
jgi:hypothetical protein